MKNTSLGQSCPTIAQLLWPASLAASHAIFRAVMLAMAGAVLLTASAKIKIPLDPVPLSLQTMVVLLLGMAYGARLGAATILLYLFSGAAGLPVFADTPEKGIGLAYMMGPTGGYLLGFVFAAWFCGKLAERGWDMRIWRVLVVMLGGNAIIYACGLLWLGSVVGWDKPILQWGLYPFLLGDALKIAFATAALPPLSRLLRK